MKPDPRVNPAKGSGHGLHELTRVNLGQPEKIKNKIFEVLIFHMKKIRNNPCKYRLYMLQIIKFKILFQNVFYPTLKRYYVIILS
jgi:hypothetical protein